MGKGVLNDPIERRFDTFWALFGFKTYVGFSGKGQAWSDIDTLEEKERKIVVTTKGFSWTNEVLFFVCQKTLKMYFFQLVEQSRF